MHRLRSTALTRAALSAAASTSSASASGHATLLPLALQAHAASAVSAQAKRAMSAGSKRNKGMPERKAGGVKLPDADQSDRPGRRRYKSLSEQDAADADEERMDALSGEGYTVGERRAAQAEYEKHGPMDAEGTQEERELVNRTRYEFAQHMAEREPLRAGEQSWREKQLLRAGIPQQADYKAVRTAKLLDAEKDGKLRSSANSRNPVLVRTRAHLNPADLPPSFDHFNVPALSAAEVDAKQKALHASYWSKYAAWKEARPEEYKRWMTRLEKRDQEKDYHWMQAQLKASAGKGAKAQKQVADTLEQLQAQAVQELLPAKHRAAFEEAAAADPDLQAAVAKLGQEEVLRRWSAYQVFLDAEISSQQRSALHETKRVRGVAREVALSAEDAVFTLNDPKLNLTLEQRKNIYRTLLGAKRNVQAVPYWTDPDPSMEGEHDWKMADAFVKPPLLPPMSHLREYATRTDTKANFSSLHRFLHYERLRQTIAFLREQKKRVVRERVRATRDLDGYFQTLLASKPREWAHIQQTYPFLSDALLQGAQSLYLAPWAQKDQQDFLTALHRNVLLIGKLLDSHFSRRNRNASWILSYPRNPRDNPDEVLRAMKPSEVRRMEAQLLGNQLMEALEKEPQLAEELEASLEKGAGRAKAADVAAAEASQQA